MKHDANISSNAHAEQVQFFFIMHFVIILHVRSQENVLLYLFRNTFDNSQLVPQPYHPVAQDLLPTEAKQG